MRRGERRSAMLSWFENLVIFLFENIKVCHVAFSHSERLRMTDKAQMVSSEWRIANGPFAIRHSPFTIR